jgi:hypothetical protein
LNGKRLRVLPIGGLVQRQLPFTSNHKASPRTAKFVQAAQGFASKLGQQSDYKPIHGQEHCPKCWTRDSVTRRLRFERHHNADALCAVCDVCGFYLVP